MTVFEHLDLRNASAVIAALKAGTAACLQTPIRKGSTERVIVEANQPSRRLIATGDLHDNPLHLMRLLTAAGMTADNASDDNVHHLTLHELIHGDRLMNGMDFSYRLLARVAALKAAFPSKIHVLLANHELAQALGHAVAKDGIRYNQAFDEALDSAFGAEEEGNAPRVREALVAFVLSLPLAVVFHIEPREGRPLRRIMCSHSLPAPEMMSRFDPMVLQRALTEDDYRARQGSAHLLVWGRGHTPEQLGELARLWNIDLFILGHEKAEAGFLVIAENALVINSDHERGVYVPLELGKPFDVLALTKLAIGLAGS